MNLTRIFKEFFHSEKIGGFILILCSVISLMIANSSFSSSYIHFWHSHVNLTFSQVRLDYSVEEWIDEGLMTIFFLLVGLEIERELYVGELSHFKNAVIPILAAVGGMAIPALIHFLLNRNTTTQGGIAIPMATDIAFSLGMLSLLGSRVPPTLKIFLTALAIIDDLGSVIIIAIFYTNNLSLFYLLSALGIFAVLIVLNRLKVYKIWIYLVAGAIMWYFMLKSGVHATITGVLLAFAIPFKKNDVNNPSYSLQHSLHMPVNYFIVPLFALANTALNILPGWAQDLRSNNSLGIFLGLLAGKPLGIFIFCWIGMKLKWGKLPEGVDWKILFGTGILAGIGFTMSIFITNLAFANDPVLIFSSKIAILLASLFAMIFGLITLTFACKRTFPEEDLNSSG